MDSLANLIETFATNELVKLAIPMAVGALIIIGLGFLLGFQRVVDWCKSHIFLYGSGIIKSKKYRFTGEGGETRKKEKEPRTNTNRIIRRFIPKGTKIRQYTKKKIEKIEYWINTMYRKSLGWKTAEECYEEERLLLGIGMT